MQTKMSGQNKHVCIMGVRASIVKSGRSEITRTLFFKIRLSVCTISTKIVKHGFLTSPFVELSENFAHYLSDALQSFEVIFCLVKLYFGGLDLLSNRLNTGFNFLVVDKSLSEILQSCVSGLVRHSATFHYRKLAASKAYNRIASAVKCFS